MAGADPHAVLDYLVQRRDEMTRLLERLTRAESPSLVPESQRTVLRLLADELESAGLAVRAVRGVAVGDHLFARPRTRRRGAPRQLLVGHMDTVWPVGTLEAMPARLEDGAFVGPGVYDMKAGLVQLVFAFHALRALGLEPTVTPVVFLNSDEEIGSAESTRWIAALARGAARAFVLEGADGAPGRLKTARKGVGRYRVVARGRAAHAGGSFAEGTSAILELSHQVQRLFDLNDPDLGVTVNVGTIDGGLRPNVVAPEAVAFVDVRAPSEAVAQALDAEIRSLTPVLPGASVEVEGRFGRTPMEATPRNRALFETARRLGATLGLELEDAGLVGGGSDANTTSLYTATLDGLGPVGAGAHAAHERVDVPSLAERAALLALLVLEPAVEPAPRRRARHGARSEVLVVGSPDSPTNAELADTWRTLGIPVAVVPPPEARVRTRHGDVLVGRLDVLPSLDGVEPGLLDLLLLERGGITVHNRAFALLGAHDKLRTARLLALAGLPHPATVLLRAGGSPALAPPVVVKPRFGSWGADVLRCDSAPELERCLAAVASRPWFRRHGALLQELVPPVGRDLRLLVAGGRVVGAIERVAAPSEWRTNVSLGGSKRPVAPPVEAESLAVAAAAAIGADLVGVDLLPVPGAGFVVLELNGAVDFGADYSLAGRSVHADAAAALGLPREASPRRPVRGASLSDSPAVTLSR